MYTSGSVPKEAISCMNISEPKNSGKNPENNNLPTIIIRHVRENMNKCSLRGLEAREDFQFYTYPRCALGKEQLGELQGYILLDVEGEPLSTADKDSGLILLDATWRLAEKMQKNIKEIQDLPKRSIPGGFKTAYPRRQDDCPDPEAGLASIEALYIAFLVSGKSIEGLFDGYYWKNQFIEKNRDLLHCFQQS